MPGNGKGAPHNRLSPLSGKVLGSVLLLSLPLATEGSLFGYLLALAVLAAIVAMGCAATYLLLPMDYGSGRAKAFRIAILFLAISFAIHWMAFSAYFNNGTLFRKMTPLVLHGSVTFHGYAFSAGHAAIVTLIVVLFSFRGRTG